MFKGSRLPQAILLVASAMLSLTSIADGHADHNTGGHGHGHNPGHELGHMAQSPAAENARVYFVEPVDGQVISAGEVQVVFGLSGMVVAPAGSDTPNSGHHHLLIDVEQLPDMRMPLPASENIRHYGKGQTETTLMLAPGRHRLQLVLGNYAHIPHNPPIMSEVIEITVK